VTVSSLISSLRLIRLMDRVVHQCTPYISLREYQQAICQTVFRISSGLYGFENIGLANISNLQRALQPYNGYYLFVYFESCWNKSVVS
jgi:hypothetical protein